MASNKTVLEEKFETINRFLDDEYLLAHIQTKGEGVILPAHLLSTATVTLKLSKLFRGGIEVTPEAVVTDLLFDNQYFTCTIPLDSIWGVTSAKGNNVIWPESAPTEVLKALVETSQKIPEAAAKGKKQSTQDSAPDASKKGAHLRRVK